MACECVCELDQKKPIVSGDRERLTKHVAAVHYKAKFSKKPQCKKGDCEGGCLQDVKYSWTITPKDATTDHVDLFDETEPECLVVGNGRFTLAVEVHVMCVCPEQETDPPSGVDLGEVTECNDKASVELIIRSK